MTNRHKKYRIVDYYLKHFNKDDLSCEFVFTQSDFNDIDEILINDGKKPLNYKIETITQEQIKHLNTIFLDVVIAGI